MLLSEVTVDAQEILRQFNAARDQYFRENSGAPELIDPRRFYTLPSGYIVADLGAYIDVIPPGAQLGEEFVRLTPDGNGGYTQTTLIIHSRGDNWFDKLMVGVTKAFIIAGTAYVGAGAMGLVGEAGAIGAGSTAGTSAGSAAGWTSGYDLAMGSDLLGMTGVGGAASTTTWLNPTTIQKALSTAKTATGLVSAITGATGGSGTRTAPRTMTTVPRTAAMPYMPQAPYAQNVIPATSGAPLGLTNEEMLVAAVGVGLILMESFS